MGDIYTSTLKYFWLAIDRFLPIMVELEKSTPDPNQKDELGDLIENYKEVRSKINNLHLNYEDPNRTFSGEPIEVRNWIQPEILENLSRLTLKLLQSWKDEMKNLRARKFPTEKNNARISELEQLIWPLDALSKSPGYLVGKYASKGPVMFPGEDKKRTQSSEAEDLSTGVVIFPPSLLAKLPTDLVIVCEEFNFNHTHRKPVAGMLLLRRILPLAIVRKFQTLDRAAEIRDGHGEFFDTNALLGKVAGLLSSQRIYRDVETHKSILDGSQHLFSLKIDRSDTEAAAVKIRILLDDIF